MIRAKPEGARPGSAADWPAMTDFRQNASGLLVPAVPTMNCSTCGEDIPKQKFPDHAEACYRANQDQVIEEMQTRENEPFFQDLDPEKAAWARATGRSPLH